MNKDVPSSSQELLDKAFVQRIMGNQRRARLLERQALQFTYPDFTLENYARHLFACAKRCAAWASYAWLDHEFFSPLEQMAVSTDIITELWAMRSYTAVVCRHDRFAKVALSYAEDLLGGCSLASQAFTEHYLCLVRRSLADRG